MAPPLASSSPTSDSAFCLKLNSHQNHLVAAFQRLYNDEVLTDCTISCQGGTIKAHKLVLSACSPYFTDLFANFSNPNQYPIVILKDMSITDLDAIVEFMYKGEATIPQSHLASVLDSAKALMIIGLMDIKIQSGSKGREASPRSNKKRKRRTRSSTISKQQDLEEVSESEISESENSDNESQTKISKKDDVNQDQEASIKQSESITECANADPQSNSRLSECPQFSTEADDSNSSQPGPSSRYSRPVLRLSPSAAFKANLRQMRIEKIQNATGGLSGRKMWSEQETKTLVDVWDEESSRVAASANKKLLSLQRISDLLQQRNVDRDVSQVEGKIKALKRDYKAVTMNKAIPAVQARMAPHLDKLETIFLREEL